jgi:hypothetical protein
MWGNAVLTLAWASQQNVVASDSFHCGTSVRE